MDPAHIIDTANELRGLGQHSIKTNVVTKVTKKHKKPQAISTPWTSFVAEERPGSTRNPALATEWILAPVEDNMLPDAIIDARSPTELIGTSTRVCAHTAMR